MTPPETYDLTDIRVEQATMLKQRVVASCVFVQFLICNYSIILLATGERAGVLLWFFIATAMVAVTYFYAKIVARSGITRANVNVYLAGHITVSSITGIIWGGFAIYISSVMEPMDLLVSVFLVCGITIGGMLPSSAYRPGYMGLATFALGPFALFILLTASWPMVLMGLAILVYFGFGIITSARAEKDMFDAIERRNAHEQAEKLKAENTIVRRVNEEKTRFLAATSHDLSQPLHAQGYFIQALREKLDGHGQKDLLDKIELSWRRQGQFLKGLVDINRLESGAIVPKPETINLQAELDAILSEFDELAKEKSIDITKALDSCRCVSDLILLNRVIRNILSNAIKYTPPGGHVHIALQSSGDTLSLSIEDNGIGIAEKEQTRVFEEYVQLNSSVDDTGASVGLGLSIVKKLATLLDIHISLISELGKGTTFSLAIPNNTSAKDKPAPQQSQQVENKAAFLHAPLVVLVDDELAIREAMSNLLTNWGCQLITTSNGEDALALLNQTDENPVLLIIDKWLRDGENGLDLIEHLREEVNEDTPALLMSGDPAGLEDRQDLVAIEFLSKPVDPESIRRAVNSAVAQ